MTDEAPTSPGEEEVRRLLVDARHSEPMPADVAVRMDRVLEGLAEEPARVAPVAQLAVRRRRTAALLVAAAAVVVVGIGINQVLQPAADEASTAARESAGSEGDGTTADLDEESAPQDGAEAEINGGGATFDRRDLVELTSSDFADDVRSFRVDALYGALAAQNDRAPGKALRQACRTDAWGAGTFVPVRYDGQPAVVVFRRPQGDTQVADLFLCGGTEPERSVTLPAP